ncbi:gag-pol polyprotein [Tanacetum coccineum]
MQTTNAKSNDITDPTNAHEHGTHSMAKGIQTNYSTPTNNNQRKFHQNPRNRQNCSTGYELWVKIDRLRMVELMVGNQFRRCSRFAVQKSGVFRIMVIRMGISRIANQNPNGNGNVVAAWAKGNVNGNNVNKIMCYNCHRVGHYVRNCIVRPRRRNAAYLLRDLDKIKEVNANCILMANLQQASTSGTQTDKALVYDFNGSAEVHEYDNCYNNEIFNMFTQEEQYTKLLEPIPEPHQV